MKEKDHSIDRLFREGFQEEEKFAPEMPDSRFDAFFPQRAEGSDRRKIRSLWWFSAAASVILVLAAFSWMYVRNLSEQLPEAASLAGKKTQPVLLSQAAPVLPQQPAATAEKKSAPLLKQEKAKPALRKQPPVKKGRKKRIGATLFPGIFPAPLFAEERDLLVDTALALVTLPQAAAEEKAASSNDVPEESAIAYANEVESVEYHPEIPAENPLELINEKPVKKNMSVQSVLAGVRQINFSKLPSIEEAKGLLFSGIGRLVGLNREPETDHAEQNSNSEL